MEHGRKFTHKQSHKMFTQSVDPRMSLQIVTVFLVKIVTNKFSCIITIKMITLTNDSYKTKRTGENSNTD